MKSPFHFVLLPLLVPAILFAQQGGHPDLSGTYQFYIDAAPVALRKVVNGKEELRAVDQSARWGKVSAVICGVNWLCASQPDVAPNAKAARLAASASLGQTLARGFTVAVFKSRAGTASSNTPS